MTYLANVIFLGLAIVCVQSQRPSYLGVGSGPVGRPGLANRFKTPEIEAEEEAAMVAAHQQAELATAQNTGLSNRFGADGTITQGAIPVDARGDVDLVNRLNQWPRENRPFWLINAAAIEGHRNNAVDASTVVQGQPPNQQEQQNQVGNAAAQFEAPQLLGQQKQQVEIQQTQQVEQNQQVPKPEPPVPTSSAETAGEDDDDSE